MPTNSTPLTAPNTNTLPISFSTARLLTKTSPTFANTLMSNGMKPPTSGISSNTTPSHYLTSTPKPPLLNHHPFPVPLPPTEKLPTSTQATQALSATSPTFYAKAAFYPVHSTLPTTLAFLLRAFASPTINLTHHPQHLATPQKHPLPDCHTPRLGRRHQIHFRRRGTSHDPTQRTPRSRLSPERQMLGHPP